jgi:hypothetical protein
MTPSLSDYVEVLRAAIIPYEPDGVRRADGGGGSFLGEGGGVFWVSLRLQCIYCIYNTATLNNVLPPHHLSPTATHRNPPHQVADVVSGWGAADLVRRAIAADKSRGPGYTAGGSARAVSIPIPVATAGAERSSEWRY